MRFVVDECTGPRVAAWLAGEGDEVFSVFDQSRGLKDDDVLSKALDENWNLITNDKDFGELVYRERRAHRGIIFLRLADERATNKIEILRQLLCLRRPTTRSIRYSDRNQGAFRRLIDPTSLSTIGKLGRIAA